MVNLVKEVMAGQSVVVEIIELKELATPISQMDSRIINTPIPMDILPSLRMLMGYDKIPGLTVLHFNSNNSSIPQPILLLIEVVEEAQHAHSLFQLIVMYTLGFYLLSAHPHRRCRLFRLWDRFSIILVCRL